MKLSVLSHAAYAQMAGQHPPLTGCGADLVGLQELDIGSQLCIAAMLAVGHQVNAASALALHWICFLLHFIHPTSGAKANYLQHLVFIGIYPSESKMS